MRNFRKITFLLTILTFFYSSLFALPFNSKLSNDEIIELEKGEILIRNINFYKNISLESRTSKIGDNVLDEIKDLNPKYLAEVIQFKAYEGNEDLPEKLEKILNNVSDYAGIPYYSERAEGWYDLYTTAEIENQYTEGNTTVIDAKFLMDPFDIVKEKITLEKEKDSISYVAVNQNKLRYLDYFDCIWPKKMKICIYVFRYEDKWILYGIGGVSAPRIPGFTERIQTSFINRINTFCSFIFKQF